MAARTRSSLASMAAPNTSGKQDQQEAGYPVEGNHYKDLMLLSSSREPAKDSTFSISHTIGKNDRDNFNSAQNRKVHDLYNTTTI